MPIWSIVEQDPDTTQSEFFAVVDFYELHVTVHVVFAELANLQ